jgi:hypothetical protein
LMKPTEEDSNKRNGMLMRVVTKLSQERMGELQERILSLIREFDGKDRENRDTENAENEGLLTYGFTVALFPYPGELPGTTTTID